MADSLKQMMAYTPGDWDAAFAQYVAAQILAGTTTQITRAEYPSYCIATTRRQEAHARSGPALTKGYP
jgi:hypothetical protein